MRRNKRGHTTDVDAQAAVESASLQIVYPTIDPFSVSSERDFPYLSLLISLIRDPTSVSGKNFNG